MAHLSPTEPEPIPKHGPGARPRVKAPDRRRDDLLTAATALFVERGVDATSVSDITRAAGVAKGTFYLYFSSREQLLESLRGQLAGAAAARVESLEPPSEADAWPAYLDALTDAALAFFTEHAALHDLLADRPHEHASTRGEGPAVRNISRTLAAVIGRGVEAGAVRVADPAIAAELLLDLLHGAVHQALLPGQNLNLVRETARAMVRGSLLCGQR